VLGQIPIPNVDNCNVTSRIIVRVEIQVDRSGNVLSASVLKATFADNCIWNVVVQAARETKFNADQSAAFKQTGWIEYTIEP
jgi:TonB family protein